MTGRWITAPCGAGQLKAVSLGDILRSWPFNNDGQSSDEYHDTDPTAAISGKRDHLPPPAGTVPDLPKLLVSRQIRTSHLFGSPSYPASDLKLIWGCPNFPKVDITYCNAGTCLDGPVFEIHLALMLRSCGACRDFEQCRSNELKYAVSD